MSQAMKTIQFSIYRYSPEQDTKPRMQDYQLEIPEGSDMMLLAALIELKKQDPTLSFRRACGEGVCGSDAMNVNGKNRLACITHLSELKTPIVIRPLPSLQVERDLIVNMQPFYDQYERAQPYLKNDTPPPAKERLQSPEERAELDGSYECILCACCTTSCPSSWWNPDQFMGPAALLWANRFVSDSRDTATDERLTELEDPFSLFRCRGIMNCVDVCPKGLNPTKAIGKLRARMLKKAV